MTEWLTFTTVRSSSDSGPDILFFWRGGSLVTCFCANCIASTHAFIFQDNLSVDEETETQGFSYLPQSWDRSDSWVENSGLLTLSSGLFLFSQLPESWGTLWGDWRSLFPSSLAWLGPLVGISNTELPLAMQIQMVLWAPCPPPWG